MTRILVTDARRGSALAFIRSLGRRGHHVVAADAASPSAGMRSRFAAARVRYPSPLDDPAATGAALVRAAHTHGIELIVPVTDEVIMTLVDRLADLPAGCQVATPDSSRRPGGRRQARDGRSGPLARHPGTRLGGRIVGRGHPRRGHPDRLSGRHQAGGISHPPPRWDGAPACRNLCARPGRSRARDRVAPGPGGPRPMLLGRGGPRGRAAAGPRTTGRSVPAPTTQGSARHRWSKLTAREHGAGPDAP